jgi:hypothetical protein
MASVPGPDPNQPLPRPGAPGAEPEYEEEERWELAPADEPWESEPWDPAREREQIETPTAVPL